MVKYLFLIIFTLSWTNAQILKKPGSFFASDLVFQGKVHSSASLQSKYNDLDGNIDLSELQPDDSVDFWDNEIRHDLPNDNELINIQYGDEVEFVATDEFGTTANIFRFQIFTTDALGIPRVYNAYVGTSAFTLCLRRALLYKLGYKTAPVKRLGKLVVNFRFPEEKKNFIETLKFKLIKDEKRWVNAEYEQSLLLQDVYIAEQDYSAYDLLRGDLTNDVIKGRRILSSLMIPFAILNIPESINLLRWYPGINNGDYAEFFYPYAKFYNTTFEDAQWITRRLFELTEDDWHQIAFAPGLPQSVALLLREKLKSRVNNLRDLLDIDTKKLKVNSKISNMLALQKGKLVQCDWQNYASRFCYGDPESPLAGSELTNMIKSKLIGMGIDIATTAFNKIPFFSTDIRGKNQQELDKLAAESYANFLQTGQNQDTPLTTWTFPTFAGGIILSRNIVAGSYLGTNNPIQLVDKVGFFLSAGVYMGMAGFNAPMAADAAAQARISRTYSHIKPLQGSFKQALDYPFKNMLVMMLKRQYAKKLNAFMNEGITDEKYDLMIKPFKDEMAIGESLIITDSIGVGALLKGIYGFSKLVQVSAGISPAKLILGRTHILRISENVFQVYKDFGNVNNFLISMGLDAVVPVVRAGWKNSAGKARSKLYTIDISKENPYKLDHILALRGVLLSNSMELLKKTQQPYKLEHNFRENDKQGMIFVFNGRRYKSDTLMTLNYPGGGEQEMFRYYMGGSTGINYEKYASEVLDYLTTKIFKTNFQLSGLAEASAGNSFQGKAKNKIMTIEGVVDSNRNINEAQATLSRSWNGWKIKKSKAKEILKKIKERYQKSLFPQNFLGNVEELFIYNIMVNFKFYERGLKKLMNQPQDLLKKVFTENCRECKNASLIQNSGIKRMLRYQKKYKKWRDEKKHKRRRLKRMSHFALKSVEIMEQKLTFEGMKKLLGGKDNFYVETKMTGFREGDETSDPYHSDANLLVAHREGAAGVLREGSPLLRFQKAPGIREDNGIKKHKYPGFTTGEFYIHWLMGRIF